MSDATKVQKQPVKVVVTVKVTPLERRAIQQRAAEQDTTMSRVARAAIIRGLNVTKKADE